MKNELFLFHMKYRQLTKEQLESLHEEFAQFLASQEIDAKEWSKIKETNSQLVEEELNLFSDMVWDRVLTNTKFVNHVSKKVLNLFKCDEFQMTRIVLQLKDSKDFNDQEDLKWVMENLKHDSIEILAGSKKYSIERNLEIFRILESGAEISHGELYNHVASLMNKS